MIITIIGLGLIGGSLALSLKQNGFASKIIGVDTDPEHQKKAMELNIADEICQLNEAVIRAQLVIIAIPVDVTIDLLPDVLENINKDTIVLDMGSTKKNICQVVKGHPRRENFIASHPIAGTEKSGPQAAFSTLFFNKVGIICDRNDSAPWAIKIAEKLYKSMYMRLVYMDSVEHDKHIAYVSHLSHISSFVLGLTVLEVEKNENTIFNMAGSGFASTVRLAKSSPEMWAPIFDQNATNLSEVLEAYIENLQSFKKLIDHGDRKEIFQLMKEANGIGRILEGIELNENIK